MGAVKYSESLVVDTPINDAFDEIKKILKKSAYPLQYENREKNIVIARVEQMWLAPAGQLLIVDLKEITVNKVEILIFSKDLIDSGMNFNRNVKNVNRLLIEIRNALG